jgi:hypothetical protein
VAAVEGHLGQLLAGLGSPGRSIPTADVKHFCRNARNIRVVRCVGGVIYIPVSLSGTSGEKVLFTPALPQERAQCLRWCGCSVSCVT